jgi:RNA polymerase primary sigma factor
MSMRQLKITKSITNRESQSLEKYLQEIGKVELISPEEEVKLATLIKQGDQRALDRLTKANLRFVVSVAKQYQNQGLSLPDLINEGNVGLIKAAQRFDETRGFKFISYAVWWIRQSILQALAEQSRIVRLPLNKVGLTNRIQKAFSLLEQQFEREPSAEELAEVLDMDLEEVTSTLGINARHVSMDSPLSEGEENTLIDVLENPNADRTDGQLDHNESLKTEIDRSLKALTERQKEVICFFFGIGVDHPMSLEDIGEKFSLTRERVRQIKDKAITKLKASNRCKLLRTYLGT